MRPRDLSLSIRIAFLLLMIFAAFTGRWVSVAINLPVFVLTLIVFWAGRHDEDYYKADALLMAIFGLYFLSYTMFPSILDNVGGVLGIDKLYHVAGGFGAAYLSVVFYKGRIKEKWVLMATVLIVTLGIGAGWEFFEWVLTQLPEPFRLWEQGLEDTMLDLVADTVGAALALAMKR